MAHATRLRCDHFEDPLGLARPRPLYTWALTGLDRGRRQAACQVLVASDPSLLESGRPDVWDSGRVETERALLRHGGEELAWRQRCYWTVRVWDDEGRPGRLAPHARYELMLGPEQWQGYWLGRIAGWHGQTLLVRTVVSLTAPIRRARVYVASVGWHQLRVNGVAADKRVLEPVQTVVSRRVPCSTYAVEDLLRPGENVLGLQLSGGYYGAPIVRVQARFEAADGSEVVLSPGAKDGGRWAVAPGPIVAASPYDGEVRDERLVLPGWDRVESSEPAESGLSEVAAGDGEDPWWLVFGGPGSRERAWNHAFAAEPPGGRILGSSLPTAAVTTQAPVVRISEPKPGLWVADAGTNGAGWVRLRVAGVPRGGRVVLRFAESLAADGTLDQRNLRGARSSDVFASAGTHAQVFEPTFAIHGFRYIALSGLAQAPELDDVVVCRARSDLARRSRFHAEPLLERIWEMVARTEESNTLGVLTDCPQRDERMGWLNDLTDRLDTAVLVHDLAPLLSKVLDDIIDSQRPDGAVPDTIPYRAGSAVADPVCQAPIRIPLLLHRHWGDEEAASRAYPMARAWARHLYDRTEEGVLNLSYYGDWSEPNSDAPPLEAGGSPDIASPVSRRTPGALVSTACLSWGLRMLAQLAALAGDASEADRAAADAEVVRSAFRRAFRDPATGLWGTGSQASLAIAVALGMAEGDEVAAAVSALAADVEQRGHLTTGNIATKFVLETLSDHGRHDLAYALARRRAYPSWGFMLDHGATTLWERWEEATGAGMNSHNHPMMGAIGSWLITRHAGLAVADDAVGSDRWVVNIPRVDGGPVGAEASVDSPRGEASVRWHRDQDRLSVSVTMPPGTKGLLHLPVELDRVVKTELPPAADASGCAVEVGGGTWVFEANFA